MIYFRSDYSLGAHPKVMAALQETNMEHTDGYGDDKFSHTCADMIREMIGRPDAHIHFMVGGTPTNTITIASALRPYVLWRYDGSHRGMSGRTGSKNHRHLPNA